MSGLVSVQNTVDTGHDDMIVSSVKHYVNLLVILLVRWNYPSLSQHDAQMDYYGKRLATCSSDRTVKIFEIVNNTQNLVATLIG